MCDESIKNPVNLDNLPDGVELFPYQVAGHKHGKGRLGLGILRHKNGQILKPLFEDNGRAVKEMTFYESVFHNPLTDPLVEELAGFLPVFYGTKCINISGKDIKYLCLEDVSGTFKNPSVLDVKIGPITYEIGASKNKINEQRSKFVHGEVCGIRVVGMKVYDEEKQLHIAQDRMYLRQLSPDTIESALSLYFTKDKFINSLMLCGFIHKLLQIDDWFSRQRRFIFIGSSILFVYEGTLSSWKDWIQRELLNCSNNIKNFDGKKSNNVDEALSNHHSPLQSGFEDTCDLCGLNKNICSEVLTNCNLFRVVMIDFAHCSFSEKEDTNYIYGLHKLLNHLKNLLKINLLQ